MMSDRVRVQIFGREYEMDSGGLTALEVQSLAHFVDDKMREISDKFAIVDTQKIAVLAAINISLDYLQLQEQKNGSAQDFKPRLESLNKVLEQALSAS
jgi:cell division protein ZapA